MMIVVTIISGLLTVSPKEAQADSYMDGKACSYNDAVDGKVPTSVYRCSTNGFKFNSKYYYGAFTMKTGTVSNLGYIVYGNVNSFVNSYGENRNRFKKGMQTDPNVPTSVVDNGHFYAYDFETGQMEYGEFEYLGFNQAGQAYHNMFFINDANASVPNVAKHWVYQPWNTLPSGFANKPVNPGLIYSKIPGANYSDNVYLPIMNNMNASLGFNISNGVKGDAPYNPIGSSYNDPREYMALDQPSTARENGFGTMWHYSWYSNKFWYQTFSLDKMTEEFKMPLLNAVDATGVVLDNQPVPVTAQKLIPVKIEVNGLYHDETFIGNVAKETLNYTRKDIKYWKLELHDKESNQMLAKYTDNATDGATQSNNTAKASYVLNVPVSKIDKTDPLNWKYTTDCKATVYFWGKLSTNGTHVNDPNKPNTVPCSVTVKFKSSPIPGSMDSLFTNRPQFAFVNKSEFTSINLSYQDESVGDEVGSYQISVTGDDGSSTSLSYSAKPSTLNSSQVNSDLYNFISSRFSATTTSHKGITFTIVQKLIDKDDPTITDSYQTGFYVEQNTLPPPPPPMFVTMDMDFPEDWYDIVPYPAKDDTVGVGTFTKVCKIDGVGVSATVLLAGQYVFGVGNQGLHNITCTSTAPDGTINKQTKWVVIHDSKPRLSVTLNGLYKQNRTMTLQNTSNSSNDKWIMKYNQISYDTYAYESDNGVSPVCRPSSDCPSNPNPNAAQSLFMYKTPDLYRFHMQAHFFLKDMNGNVLLDGSGNPYRRDSDPYLLNYMIFPDYQPAIIVHSYESQISRLDQLNLFYDVQSTDGDFIANKSLTVYYDSKNDGTFDTNVYSTTGDITQLPKFTALGQYKIVATAKEGTTQDRLMEYITAADDQTKTVTSYFFIDNYEPSSDLYVDIPNQKPNIDIFFMLDSNLTQSETDYITSNRVTITNAMTSLNMNPAVSLWDMKTYTYTQPASTSSHTGSSYPSGSTGYSSGGYSGTLSLVNVSNANYSTDEGHDDSVTDSKGVSGSCSNTVAGHYNAGGTFVTDSSSSCGGSLPYSDGTYSGTMNRGTTSPSSGCSYTGTPGGSCSTTFTASYSGTAYWTHMVHTPVMVNHNDYTGQYSGTIYKYVRQGYDVSFFRNVSTKYIIYISDNTVSQPTDLTYAINKNNVDLITIGQSGINGQYTADKYIQNNKSIDQLVNDALAYIAQNNPEVPKVIKLIGDSVISHTATFDFEGDPTPASGDKLLITQDPSYFDNSMGFDTVNGALLTNNKTTSVWKSYVSTTTFNKTGLYKMYRKTKDLPTVDPRFSAYAYESNESEVDIIVHRKPIADFILDWDYDSNSNLYITHWVDKSYDWDHNVTRANSDKGIVANSMSFTNNSTGEVFTAVPTTLAAGSYTVNYAVKDMEGEWSDPVSKTITLAAAPPMQFLSNLKTQSSSFSLFSIPASENLQAFQLWTRYPYSVSLGMQMGGYINQTINYYSGTKNGNDINWNDVIMQIPATTPDGPYTFNISANGSGGGYANNPYSVTVNTPINLVPTVPVANALFVVGYPATFTATTSKYPTSTTATLFYGTGYAQAVSLSPTVTGSGKTWNYYTATFPDVPDGNYTIRFTATLPSGKYEVADVPIKSTHNTPPFGDFKTYTYDSNNTAMPKFEGDTVHLDPVGVGDNEHDQLAVNYTVKDPANTVVLNQNFTYNFPYPTSGGPTFVASSPGTYTATLTLNDGKAAAVTVTHTFTVLALSISGAVSHTVDWENYRLQWNAAGRTPTHNAIDFWAGEALELSASVTNTTSSTTKPTAVTATLVQTGDATSMTSSDLLNYYGEMAKAAFIHSLSTGAYTMRYKVTWSTGVSKTTDVAFNIKGNINDVMVTQNRD